MTASLSLPAKRAPPNSSLGANRLLAFAAAAWTVTALIGQWAFAAYTALVYGPTSLTGDFEAWNRNKSLITGYVAGDTAGNLAFAGHVLAAAVVSLLGALQLVPAIRARAPAVHRWSGRAFLITAIGASLAGLYMVWVRGTMLGLLGGVAVSGNAILILAFAALAWRTALARDFAVHRRLALRLFLVANGQWFFRVGMMGWMITTHGLGSGRNLDGPFDIFLGFGCYLVPLAFLELYLRTRERGGAGARRAVAAALLALTAFMAIGIAGAGLMMWAPVVAKVL